MEAKTVTFDGDLASRFVTATKETIERILKCEHPSDCLALYMFYCYTAKWQNETCVKATTAYVGKGLGWSEDKVRARKGILASLGLIEDVRRTGADSKKILGWYVQVKFILEPPSGFSRVWFSPQCGESGDKCSETVNGNALRPFNKNAPPSSEMELPLPDSNPNPKATVPTTPPIAPPPQSPPVNGSVTESELEWADDMAVWFRDLIPANMRLSANWRDKWAEVFLALSKKDKRSDDEISKVCEWARSDAFWSRNFYSPAKLRERKDGILYFDRFLELMKKEPKKVKLNLAL